MCPLAMKPYICIKHTTYIHKKKTLLETHAFQPEQLKYPSTTGSIRSTHVKGYCLAVEKNEVLSDTTETTCESLKCGRRL